MPMALIRTAQDGDATGDGPDVHPACHLDPAPHLLTCCARLAVRNGLAGLNRMGMSGDFETAIAMGRHISASDLQFSADRTPV